MLVRAEPTVSRKQKLKDFFSVALLITLLIGGAVLLATIAWGIPIYLMWQGGWWAMLGLGLWMFFTLLGKLTDKLLS